MLQCTLINILSDYHRRSKKCSGPIPVSDDIVTSQTVGINDLGKAPSPVVSNVEMLNFLSCIMHA